ncbi:ParB/RepB/Spo0J family partition protein [Paraburkholderia sp. GAS33]|uniref:ParB/RepB/Spo0J family partition protein n=1 Tax=Paraburkholderia sp. GAS33 TaxID=3035130 RepID=UPI003D2333DD
MRSSSVINVALDSVRILNPRVRAKRQHQGIIDSIAAVGLKRPITVSVSALGNPGQPYDLVCGQGRMAAVHALGHTEVPALVIDEDEDECLVRGLVENVARRNHTPQELLRDIESLKKSGLTDDEVADRTGLSVSYVRDVLTLLEHGEDRLLEAVERGSLPIGIAMEIARCDEPDMQKALASAYAGGTLKGKQLKVVRQLIARRASAGRALQASGTHGNPRTKRLSPEQLQKLYVQETARQKILVKRAELTHSRLTVLIEMLRVLRADAEFVALLKQEGFTTVPEAVEQRIRREIS